MNNKEKLQPIIFLLATLLVVFSSVYFFESATVTKPTTAYAADSTITTSKTSPADAQFALTFRASTKASGLFSGNGLNVPLSTNIHPGDLLIAVAGTNGPTTSWTTPAGWTQGTNGFSSSPQGLMWWWKIADGSEAGSSIMLQSSSYADGGVVVNVYEGQSASPIVGASQVTTTDNFGNGHVTSADVAGISLGSQVTAVPLIFASWQPNDTTVTSTGFTTLESTDNDGYSYVATWEVLNALTTNTFPGYTLSFSPGQAIVQTLQILVGIRQ